VGQVGKERQARIQEGAGQVRGGGGGGFQSASALRGGGCVAAFAFQLLKVRSEIFRRAQKRLAGSPCSPWSRSCETTSAARRSRERYVHVSRGTRRSSSLRSRLSSVRSGWRGGRPRRVASLRSSSIGARTRAFNRLRRSREDAERLMTRLVPDRRAGSKSAARAAPRIARSSRRSRQAPPVATPSLGEAQVLGQERLHGAVEVELVLLVGEPVALVLLDQVLDRDAVRA